MKKPVLLILIAVLLWFLRGQELDLAALRTRLDGIAAIRQARPVATAG